MRIASSIVEIARSVRIEDLLDERGVFLSGTGFNRAGPCPLCGGEDRFGVSLKKNLWNCRGCHKGGDPISFLMHFDDLSFQAACRSLAGLGGVTSGLRNGTAYRAPREKTDAEIEAEEHDRIQREKARYFYSLSKPGDRSIVASYLKTRGITIVPPAVHALTRISDCVSMLVAYGQPGEPVTAIHQTFLKADGSGKADIRPNKITIGSPAGRPLIIAPINETRRLAICEGVEDALSVFQALGIGAWASGGASFMPSLVDAVPLGAEVTLYPHDDENNVGQRAVEQLAAGLVARGITVFEA